MCVLVGLILMAAAGSYLGLQLLVQPLTVIRTTTSWLVMRYSDNADFRDTESGRASLLSSPFLGNSIQSGYPTGSARGNEFVGGTVPK